MTQPGKNSPTKDALLQEGIQQLAQNGYHGTGIKQILDAVNVPKGSFYNYFASKEAYVAEIIAQYNQQSIALFDQLIAASDAPALEKLEMLYSHMLEKYAAAQFQKGCLIGSLAAEIGHRYELCQTAMQLSVKNWQSRLINLITQAQQEGSIRTDIAPEVLTEVLWSTWEGVLLKMQMDGNDETAQRVLGTLFKQLLSAEQK
ncbi:MAG: TetR/AcrR family transcriptional regulator [Thiolinea sp.]